MYWLYVLGVVLCSEAARSVGVAGSGRRCCRFRIWYLGHIKTRHNTLVTDGRVRDRVKEMALNALTASDEFGEISLT